MKNLQKVLSLVLVVVLLVTITGCGSSKAPDGISQDFYNNSVKYIESLSKTLSNITQSEAEESLLVDFDNLMEYSEKYVSADLTFAEQSVYDDISALVILVDTGINSYFDTGDFITEEEVSELVERLSRNLEIEIDVNDLIKK